MSTPRPERPGSGRWDRASPSVPSATHGHASICGALRGEVNPAFVKGELIEKAAAADDARLREAGGRVDYACYDGMIHGFAPMGRLIDTGNRAVSHIAGSLRPALG